MTDNRSLRQFLQMMVSTGISHLPTVRLPPPPAPRTLKKPTRPPATSAASPNVPPRTKLAVEAGQAPPMLDETSALMQRDYVSVEEKTEGLAQLAELVAGCQRCPHLVDSRRQTVFGVGNPDAKIMFVGEAPGADEDRQGEPFVGAAGQLLNKIIEACGLKREDLYICNILRCRPPGNRNPQPAEALNCREFLDGQIKIVNPDYIICWGTVAAQNLLGEQRPVGKLRGQFLSHKNAKVLCTYHPSYLLRNPSAKKQVWEDMQFFLADLKCE